MKTIILAGGLGSRMQELTDIIPKPMINIGERPILWHIMKIYATYGYNEFCIALGYKGNVIKDYFLNYRMHNNPVSVELKNNNVTVHREEIEDWTVHLIDSGQETQTGGRIKKLREFIGNKRFMMTYGDGVSDINIKELVAFHKAQGKLATVTAVQPPSRFGNIEIDDNIVRVFSEKAKSHESWVSGGFFVLEPEVFDYIDDDSVPFERAPLERLANEKQLAAYSHSGSWHCMDTQRDINYLNEAWKGGRASWKIWDS